MDAPGTLIGEMTMKRWQAQLLTLLVSSLPLGACSDAGGRAATPAPFSQGGTTATPAENPAAGTSVTAGGGTPATTTSDSFLTAPNDLTSQPIPDAGPKPTPFPESPSCVGSQPNACQGESCCRREGVNTSEAMLVAPNTSASLSSFLLDKFEVTVGRFRTFVSQYNDWREANPALGAGAQPHTAGSGWTRDPAWEADLAGSAAVLKVNLACNAGQQTWTNEPGPNEQRPINCVSWYEAFAFCSWDEARLPTEAEWQYAAVGGAQNREFAWGTTDLMQNFALYACLGAGTGTTCSVDDILPVGSRQDGNGRFRQSDLTGSMYEWTLDWYAPYPEVMRDDYAKTDVGTERVLRGGAWNSTKVEVMRSTDRTNRRAPDFRSTATGIRCVHDREETVH